MTSRAARRLAALLVLTWAVQASAGTGKVPVEGAVSASNTRPAAGESPVWIYFSATPLEDRRRVTLEITLPHGVSAVDGASMRQSFDDVAKDTTLHLVVAVTVADEEQKDIFASATLDETQAHVARRSFHLQLNPAPPVADRGRTGTSADGKGLIIYDAGP